MPLPSFLGAIMHLSKIQESIPVKLEELTTKAAKEQGACGIFDEKYGDKDFVIIGFPANNFLFQEPGTDEEIAVFCEKNYGVTFPMMSKISVKGSDMHAVYQFLTQASKNGYKSSSVSWNFQKYLIGTDGKLEKIITPRTAPMSEEVLSWVEEKVTVVN